jgi:hypothetical protein
MIRVIAVHHLRHTTASLLKKLHVSPRDAQMILGHGHISTTMQIYTHVDEEARDDALIGLDELLGGGRDPATVVNSGGQPPLFKIAHKAFRLVGALGFEPRTSRL